jgi:hypothetical protein
MKPFLSLRTKTVDNIKMDTNVRFPTVIHERKLLLLPVAALKGIEMLL